MTAADAAAAVRLVLAPRALTLPADAAAEEGAADEREDAPDASSLAPADSQPRAAGEQESRDTQDAGADSEMLVAAAPAVLPDHLLERIVIENLRAARAPRRSGSGRGRQVSTPRAPSGLARRNAAAGRPAGPAGDA